MEVQLKDKHFKQNYQLAKNKARKSYHGFIKRFLKYFIKCFEVITVPTWYTIFPYVFKYSYCYLPTSSAT